MGVNTVSIIVVLAIVLCLVSPGYTQSGKRNVLFFAVDDLRPELGTYGFSELIKSPNIDELASKSMQFGRAYCQVAVCSPSRASLLTGRRPDTNHVWHIASDEYWRNYTNATTIPQYFKENGYVSIGMGKIFHPGAPSGKDDEAYSWSPEGLPYFHSLKLGRVGVNRTSWWSYKGYSDNQLRDGDIADNAVSVIKQLKSNKTKNGDKRPFFLAVGFHKPHLPFYAPDRYFDMYPEASDIQLPSNPNAPVGMPPIAWSVWDELKNYPDLEKIFPNTSSCRTDIASIESKDCHVPENLIRQLRRAYYACISYTDAQIGRVIKELENQDFAEDTVIVLWADHGWQLGEHNEWCKHTNFEDAVHVPFLLHVPGVTDDGMKTQALVELIDIFPTLTDLAGIDTPPMCSEGDNSLTCVEGTSVLPLLKDPTRQWKKAAFSQYARPGSGLKQIPGHPPFDKGEHEENVMGYTIRVDQYRFTEWYRFNRTTAKPHWEEIWGTELYDHRESTEFFNDENVNLADKPEMKTTVEELRKILQAGWRAALPPSP